MGIFHCLEIEKRLSLQPVYIIVEIQHDVIVIFHQFFREFQERGDLWILYTMREGATLEQAVAALAELGLRPDAINDNLPERCARFGNNPRKIYADIYIDDHNAGGLRLPVSGERK